MRKSKIQRTIYLSRLGYYLKRKKITHSEFADTLGTSWRTVFRYIHGQRFPDPARLSQMAKLLGVKPVKLFPDYFKEFIVRKDRKHFEWRNKIIFELVRRGWDIPQFSRECNIGEARSYDLAGWSYPPTNRMLKRLEKGLKMNRDRFWFGWRTQQKIYYRGKAEEAKKKSILSVQG